MLSMRKFTASIPYHTTKRKRTLVGMSKTNPKVKVNKRIHERKTGGDAGYKDCVSTEEQSEYEEVNPNPTRSHRKTNVNIALNITNKGSNQVNSWLKTNRVPWRLLLFISGFVITIVLTIIVTFFSTKDKCSEKKTQQHTSCLSNPCLHSGSCYESGKNYACVCPNGTEGSRCQDEFYEAITSHGYPLEYNIQSPKTWNINVGDGNTVRIKFTDFVLSAGEDVKIYNGQPLGIFTGYTGNTLPQREWTSTGKIATMVFTCSHYDCHTQSGFRAVIYKRTTI